MLFFIMEYNSLSASLGVTESGDLTRVSLNENTFTEILSKSKERIGKFKYGAIDGSLIIAVFEKPLFKTAPTGNANSCPTLTILLRGPFTCQAWSLHLRNSPFSKMANEAHKEAKSMNASSDGSNAQSFAFQNPGSTLTMQTKESKAEQAFRSDQVTNGQKLVPKCEQSIPSLSDVSSMWVKNLTKFQNIKEDQIKFEMAAVERVKSENSKISSENTEEPALKTSQDFQSARMLLSHLGFCSLESSSTKNNKDDLTDFIGIDSSDATFFEQLTALDNLPTRTFSSSSIFYVKKNQSNAKAIINNINSNENLDESFFYFLQSLGSIVQVAHSKDPDTIPVNASSSPLKETEGSAQEVTITENKELLKKLNKINGIDSIFYWADISSEIVFYLPNNMPITEPLDESFKAKNQSIPSDTKILIIWLEQVQDADSVPVDDLLHETYSYENYVNQKPKEVIIIFIIPLKSKMHRILIWNNLSKKYFYTMPLVDGMLVSSRMLGSMIRQTVLNIFRRKRLEIDDYQPPHVRRKNKIFEIIKKFQSKKSEADFYTSLLMH